MNPVGITRRALLRLITRQKSEGGEPAPMPEHDFRADMPEVDRQKDGGDNPPGEPGSLARYRHYAEQAFEQWGGSLSAYMAEAASAHKSNRAPDFRRVSPGGSRGALPARLSPDDLNDILGPGGFVAAAGVAAGKLHPVAASALSAAMPEDIRMVWYFDVAGPHVGLLDRSARRGFGAWLAGIMQRIAWENYEAGDCLPMIGAAVSAAEGEAEEAPPALPGEIEQASAVKWADVLRVAQDQSGPLMAAALDRLAPISARAELHLTPAVRGLPGASVDLIVQMTDALAQALADSLGARSWPVPVAVRLDPVRHAPD